MSASASRPFFIALLFSIAFSAVAEPVFDPAAALNIRGFPQAALPQISPNGDFIAYGVTDLQADGNVAAYWSEGTLHVVRSDGTRALAWPADVRGSHPVWSPDSTRLAFVRRRGNESHLAWWDAGSGEMHAIGPDFTTLSPSKSGHRFAPHWSPNGKTLIAAIPENQPKAEHQAVTVLSNTDQLLPGDEAFIDKQPWRLIRVDITNGHSRTLLSGRRFRELKLSRNGAYWWVRAVIPDSKGHFAGDGFMEELGEWIGPVDGLEPAVLLNLDGAPAWTALAPDGRSIFYLNKNELHQHGHAGDHVRCANIPAGAMGLSLAPNAESLAFLVSAPASVLPGKSWLMPPATAGDLVLMDVESCSMTTLLTRDLDETYSLLTWSADGSSLFFRGHHLIDLRERLYRAGAPDFTALAIYEADEHLRAFSPSTDGTKLTFLGEHARQPAEAWLWRKENSGNLRLTNLNPQLAAYPLVAPDLINFETTSGQSRRALLYLPPETTRQSPAAVIVYIYSWLSQSKNQFQAHAQMHAARGYAFLMPDVGIFIGDLYHPYVDSVLPALKQARSSGLLSAKAGIYGGSLGGYGGLVLLANNSQFDAAVLRAPPTEFATSWATGKDRDAVLLEFLMGGSPLEMANRYRQHSPFLFADRIKAPLLLLHGRDDEQVPLAQGVMMFQALRRQGRITEMIIYDGADHSIVRGSRNYYLDYYTRTLDWWDRFLN